MLASCTAASSSGTFFRLPGLAWPLEKPNLHSVAMGVRRDNASLLCANAINNPLPMILVTDAETKLQASTGHQAKGLSARPPTMVRTCAHRPGVSAVSRLAEAGKGGI